MEAEYPPNWSITDAIQKLRANAILAVSLAVCKAGAMVNKIPLYQHIANLTGNKTLVLPVPAFNVINHEFMILPTGAASFKEAMKTGVEVYHHVKSIIKKKYGQDATNVGDEGGFAPNIQENKEGLEMLKVAIAKAGYTGKVVIGMDVAASEFYSEKDQTYALNFKEDRVAKAISEKTCNALLLKIQFAFSLNPEAANMVEEGKVLMELRLLASYNMVNPEAEDIVEEGKVLMEG
ncbi:hypothetical protein ZWY2020_010124 [Hordeum vulgare]|nr:hypothetical protein ZWY2020_010124 [Hordeum vulgare]